MIGGTGNCMATVMNKELYGFEYREEDRRRVENRKTYEVKRLWQLHHEIVSLSVRGFKQVEIAYILNITPQTVSNILNSELGRHKVSEIRQERDEDTKRVIEKVRVLTDRALEVYHEVFDDESGKIGLKDKIKVADTVMLELSGHRVPTRVDSRHLSLTLTPQELEEFKQRGIQAARESGLVIAEPESETDSDES